VSKKQKNNNFKDCFEKGLKYKLFADAGCFFCCEKRPATLNVQRKLASR
jgi:hypothetical protein